MMIDQELKRAVAALTEEEFGELVAEARPVPAQNDDPGYPQAWVPQPSNAKDH